MSKGPYGIGRHLLIVIITSLYLRADLALSVVACFTLAVLPLVVVLPSDPVFAFRDFGPVFAFSCNFGDFDPGFAFRVLRDRVAHL